MRHRNKEEKEKQQQQNKNTYSHVCDYSGLLKKLQHDNRLEVVENEQPFIFCQTVPCDSSWTLQFAHDGHEIFEGSLQNSKAVFWHNFFAVLLVPVEKGRQCKLFCKRNIKIKTILIVIILM